jgi:hypothetical protein
MAVYAMIGSREATQQQQDRMYNIARRLVKYGHEVSTGGASNIDEAAMNGAASIDPSKLHVFLPWQGYTDKVGAPIPNGANTYMFSEATCPNWNASVDKYHPNPVGLTRGPRALHARNFGILMYPEPVAACIAVPKTLTNLGGTGQGMRIAVGEGITLYNMLIQDDRTKLKELLEAMK